MFHPAAIIYNRKLIEHWNADMEIVKKEIGQKNIDNFEDIAKHSENSLKEVWDNKEDKNVFDK